MSAARPKTLDPKLSVSQIFDLIFVHAEVVSDFVQHRQADFFAQLVGVGKVFEQRFGEDGNLVGQQRQVEARSFREGHALINTVQAIVAWIESLGAQERV